MIIYFIYLSFHSIVPKWYNHHHYHHHIHLYHVYRYYIIYEYVYFYIFIAVGDLNVTVNGTMHQGEFKSHQWFGATVRVHEDSVLVRSFYFYF